MNKETKAEWQELYLSPMAVVKIFADGLFSARLHSLMTTLEQ